MPQDNRPIDSPVQPCQCVKHTFDIALVATPDATPRPAWWPADAVSAYGNESMSIELSGVEQQQALSGGAFNASGIPPGVAKVQFDKFYDDVRADLERRTNIGEN